MQQDSEKKYDDWSLFDDVVSEYELSNSDKDGMDVTFGVCHCKYDDITLFRFRIIEKDLGCYRKSFNADWCPKEQREWLAKVIAHQMVELVASSKKRTQNMIKDKLDDLLCVIGHGGR